MPLFGQWIRGWRKRHSWVAQSKRRAGSRRRAAEWASALTQLQRLEDRTLLASVTVSFQNGVNNYDGTTDSRILGDNVTRNDGNNSAIQSHGGPDRAALIRWDVSSIAPGAIVESASITLNVLDKSTQSYEIYALLKPWVENQVSWNLAANGSNWSTAGAQGATDRNSTPLGAVTSPGTGLITVQFNAEGLTRIQSWINTPGGNNGIILQDYANTDGLEISSSEAVTASLRPKLTITYATSTTPPVNQPPTAVANTYSVNRGATLAANDVNGTTGTTNDDSVLRNDTDPENNPLTAALVSGPAHATTFTLNTNGTFNYVHNNNTATTDSFTYRVSDGTNNSNTVTVTINIIASPPPTNQPPLVDAGADQAVLFPNGVSLDGTVSDDNLPNPPAAVTTTWSKVSGPGTVTFASPSSVDTTATFSAPGTYVLRLTANDLALSQFDEVTINVNPALIGVTTVTFQNGVDGYNGMIDSRIRSDNTTRNDGNLTTMQSHGNPDRASLLRWDLSSIQPGAVVDSASITLNVVEKSTQAYELYSLLKPWVETEVTWNRASAGSNWSTPGATHTTDRGSAVLASLTGSATGLITIQLNAAGITALQNWINNPTTNHGFIIQDYGATDGLELSSSEAANVAIRPKLSITIAEDRTPKLQKIVEGLNLYQDTFGELPVDEIPELYESVNSPYLSWRVHILPFIGYGDLYQQFHLDEAWDSPHNLTLLDQMPDVFRSRGLLPGTNLSGFRMFQGNGAFEYGKSILPAFNGTYDGAEHTLLVLETMAQNADFWTRPDEIQFNPANPLASLTLPNDAFLVATLDGKIKQVKRTVSAQTFAAFTTWDGNEVLSAAQYNELYVGWDAVDSVEASRQKLRELNLAMYAYHDANFAFPPGPNYNPNWIDPATDKPYLSWRVHLLSVMGYHDLYAQFRFDEPWNSAHNIQLLDKMPAEFRSRGLAAGATTSAFKLLYGPEAYYLGNTTTLGGPRLNDVRDGLSSTLQIIELTSDKAVPWTQWNETDFSSENPLAGIGPIPAGGLRAIMYDGNVHTINPAVLGENFKVFATDNQFETFTTAQAANVFLDWPLPDTVENRSQKMRDLALAFHNYHDTYSNFPVDGLAANWDAVNNRPKLSWRVYLLPFIGYGTLYQQFHLDEAWDSPHNIQLLDYMPEIYRTRGLPGNSHLTAVKLFIDETAYRYRTFSDGSGAGPRYSDILDGTLNTIAAIELLPDQAVEWTRPDGDIDFDPANALAGVGTIPSDGLLVTLFDGIVKTINPAATAENFSKFVTSRSGEIFGPAETSNVFLDWQKPFPTSYFYPQNPLRQERLYSSLKLKQLMIGFLNFEDTYNFFPIDYDPDNWDMTASTPTSGVPNLSWRVHILPYIEYGSLYEQFHLDEAWDSPHNIQLLDKMPEIFRSRGLPGDSTKSGFKLFMGEGAYEFNPTTLPNEPSYVGPRQFQLEDGSSNTIAIIETAPEDALEWTRPDSDIAWNPADPYGGLTIPPDYFLAAMFDGGVRNLNPLLDEAILRALVTWDGGEIITYPDE
ncbi:MAG: DUF1559 domain-containing protein [Planctomycetaceae bacterium]